MSLFSALVFLLVFLLGMTAGAWLSDLSVRAAVRR
jgi:hypothetical protein